MQLLKRFTKLLRRIAGRKRSTQNAAPLAGIKVHFDVLDDANEKWSEAERGFRITVPRIPIIGPKTKIFAMGSCFAIEIRKAFENRNFDVYPKYCDIKIDRSRQRASKLPARADVTHYDTFTIRQEFENALSGRHYELKDFLRHTHTLNNGFAAGGRNSWQDPYRRKVFAASEEAILDISRKLDDCIADGIRKAEVYIITLGLVETWRNKQNGAHICLPPYDDNRGGLGRFDYIEFHHSDFQENVANLRSTCRLINENFPGRKIVLTVSPVPLARTYTNKDVWVATVEAKSILRAAASQICREFPNVIYWPSYELCIKDDIYKHDGRHVREDAVGMIVQAFAEAHVGL